MQFSMLDESGKPFTGVDWSVEPIGSIDAAGQLSVGSEQGETTVTAKNANGQAIDSLSITVGCRCFWSVNLDGLKDQGEIVTSGQTNIAGINSYLVNFIDATKLVPSITGQGVLSAPSSLSVTFQKGETTYLSGLPVNTNILSALKSNTQCQTPGHEKLVWSVYNKHWLRGSLIGTAATLEDFASACVQKTVPFSLEFMLAIDQKADSKTSVEDSIMNAFSGLISDTDVESSCLAQE